MVRIRFYGGVAEVGGNKILVESGNTRLMLDFGKRMGFDSLFFAKFLDPRPATEQKDRIMIGALPKIDGIYREDLFVPTGWHDVDLNSYPRLLKPDSPLLRCGGIVSFDEMARENGKGGLDAILLSHAHLDHTGDIAFLHSAIPLYCSEKTKILVDAIDEITTFKSEAIDTKRNEISATTKGFTPGAPQSSREKQALQRQTHIMADGQTSQIGDFSVRLIQVDHSVPGAASYVLESEGRRLLYTGDIRFHGTHPMKMDDYVKAVGNGIDVMICEGTRIESTNICTEDQVKDKIAQKVKATKGLVFIDFSWKDTTRYETVRQVAADSNRIFVINARLAYILAKLGAYPDEKEPIKVFLKRKGTALYSPVDYSKQKHEYGLSVDWENNIDDRHYTNGLTAQQIMDDPGKYILMLSFFDMGQIFDFTDKGGLITDSVFIRAQCEPFSDEMEIDEEKMINWLEKFGIGYDAGATPLPPGCTNSDCEKLRRRIDRSHVSGHASMPELLDLISKVRPKTLMPIHTERPDLFDALVGEIETKTGFKVNLVKPEMEKPYDI